MPEHESDLARLCAELIRAWHEHYGQHRPARMNDAGFARYRERLAYFHTADFSDQHAQAEIAHEQSAGAFESDYSEKVPIELWKSITREYGAFDQSPFANLGSAARWLTEYLARDGDGPFDWKGHRVAFVAQSQEEVLRRSIKLYAEILGGEVDGLGGINVLISCSLERYRWTPRSREVTLLDPEIMGLRIVSRDERPDDIVDALRQGTMIINGVVGGPS